MGRRAKYTVGSSHNGWVITEAAPRSSDTNRMITVSCESCGTLRTIWAARLVDGKMRCPGCSSTSLLETLVSGGKAPILAVYDTSITIVMPGQIIPTDAKLFQMVDGKLALPYLPQKEEKPKPSDQYLTYIEVPADYLDYYCPIEGRAVSESITNAAVDYYLDNVDYDKVGSLPVHAASSRVTWQGEGRMMAYLYWVNYDSWPKGQEKPEGYKKAEVAVRKPFLSAVKAEKPVAQQAAGGLEEALETLKQLKEADDTAFEAKRQAELAGQATWDLEAKAIATSAAVQGQEEKIQRMRFPI